MEKQTLVHLQDLATFLRTNLKKDDLKVLKDYAKCPSYINYEELHALIVADIAIAEENANDACSFKEGFLELYSRLKNNDHDYLTFILFELQK